MAIIGPRLFSVDTSELDKLERDLQSVKRKAFPFAVRQTLNDIAFDARREYADEAGETMKLRGPWTVKSMRVDRVDGIMVSRMVATTGSVEEYMATQEAGADESKKGTHGVPIPAAAPGRRKTRGKVGGAKRLGAINLVKGAKKGSRQVRNASAIAMAARRGGGDVFLDLRKRKGIYRVSPGGKRGVRVRKIWDLSKSRVRIPSNTMLDRAKDEAMRGLFPHYREALISQLRRAGAFGY